MIGEGKEKALVNRKALSSRTEGKERGEARSGEEWREGKERKGEDRRGEESREEKIRKEKSRAFFFPLDVYTSYALTTTYNDDDGDCCKKFRESKPIVGGVERGACPR